MGARAMSAAAERDGDEAVNAVLDLVEQAMRTAVDLGAGPQLTTRAMRILPGLVAERSAPARQSGSNQRSSPASLSADLDPPAAPLGQIELSLILGALKDQRGRAMTGDMLARNLRARGLVLGAMRGNSDREAAA